MISIQCLYFGQHIIHSRKKLIVISESIHFKHPFILSMALSSEYDVTEGMSSPAGINTAVITDHIFYLTSGFFWQYAYVIHQCWWGGKAIRWHFSSHISHCCYLIMGAYYCYLWG